MLLSGTQRPFDEDVVAGDCHDRRMAGGNSFHELPGIGGDSAGAAGTLGLLPGKPEKIKTRNRGDAALVGRVALAVNTETSSQD